MGLGEALDEVIDSVRSGAAEIGLLGSAGDLHAAELRVLPIEDQPLILISPPDHDLPAGDTVRRTDLHGRWLIVSQRGSLMRRLVDDILAGGTQVRIAVEIAHRTSILPLVLAGFGHAVMPASWTPLAERAGAAVHHIEPASHLRVALVSRPAVLTPAARAFLDMAAAWPDGDPGTERPLITGGR
ncbi:LysR substrate-binding domain-containing protein [Actinomadura sp. 21ATH]|uniref:LysR substrate-binding domain-containing protein n=1 Tax=Actinomadura sp. 21ATH TaxID=1735444 RepID=UPI0035C115B2